jgi:hypothetical protein
MVAIRRDTSERDRQALLTFRLSAAIVVLTALLGWTLADRYFGLWAAVEAALVTPTISPNNSDPVKNPACSADAANKMDSSAWATVCPPASSSTETPATITNVAGSKTETL